MSRDWSSGEVLKGVFLHVDGKDLVSCMLVCRQWRDIARHGYLWKCICARRWPSTCKGHSSRALNYHKLFLTFSQRRRPQSLPEPRLSFEDLEFYIDIWSGNTLIFSDAVSGPALRAGIKSPPAGICDGLRAHLDGPMDSPDYKMIMSIDPQLTIPLGTTVNASILLERRDTSKMACIIDQSLFDYVDGNASRALAYDYLNFSPLHPFISGIRAWVSLFFTPSSNDGIINVFGIELDFCDAARLENEVLWLLDMLDWK